MASVLIVSYLQGKTRFARVMSLRKIMKQNGKKVAGLPDSGVCIFLPHMTSLKRISRFSMKKKKTFKVACNEEWEQPSLTVQPPGSQGIRDCSV